jgi:hypothetical protein
VVDEPAADLGGGLLTRCLRPRHLGRTQQSAADHSAKACDTGEAQEIPPSLSCDIGGYPMTFGLARGVSNLALME